MVIVQGWCMHVRPFKDHTRLSLVIAQCCSMHVRPIPAHASRLARINRSSENLPHRPPSLYPLACWSGESPLLIRPRIFARRISAEIVQGCCMHVRPFKEYFRRRITTCKYYCSKRVATSHHLLEATRCSRTHLGTARKKLVRYLGTVK